MNEWNGIDSNWWRGKLNTTVVTGNDGEIGLGKWELLPDPVTIIVMHYFLIHQCIYRTNLKQSIKTIQKFAGIPISIIAGTGNLMLQQQKC